MAPDRQSLGKWQYCPDAFAVSAGHSMRLRVMTALASRAPKIQTRKHNTMVMPNGTVGLANPIQATTMPARRTANIAAVLTGAKRMGFLLMSRGDNPRRAGWFRKGAKARRHVASHGPECRFRNQLAAICP